MIIPSLTVVHKTLILLIIRDHRNVNAGFAALVWQRAKQCILVLAGLRLAAVVRDAAMAMQPTRAYRWSMVVRSCCRPQHAQAS